AICEQTEDPKSATKLIRREVIRVITPGTALENQLLETKQNCYLASICGSGAGMGLSVLDVSTGEFLTTQFQGESAWQGVQEQLEVFSPREIIFPNSLAPLLERGRRQSNPADQSEQINGPNRADSEYSEATQTALEPIPLSDARLHPASLSDP